MLPAQYRPATRALILLATVACLRIVTPASAQQAPAAPGPRALFTPVEGPAVARALGGRESDRLAAYRADPTAAEVSVVRLDVERARSADAVSLDLGAGRRVVLDRVDVRPRGPGNYSWHGASSSGADEVNLVVEGATVVGTVRAGGELYRVRPLDGGLQALIRVDQSRLPPDHPPEFENLQRQAPRERRGEALDPRDLQDPCSEYTAVVAYTPGAKTEVGGGAIDALVQLAVDETNQSYQNSGINTRLRLVHRYETSYTESGDMALDRDRFRAPGDGFMEEVHALRDQHAADVAILITASGNFCGIAADIYASESTAFAVVGQNCATGYYSFGHEIGHLQGARHNPEADPTNTPFAYGHGYYYEPGRWRTIMSYACPAGCDRVQNWSNPDVLRGGVPMGTANHNNARVLNETACRVANFRSAPVVGLRPLAFGIILANGQRASGTGNWTSSYNVAQGRYEIAITGENYYYLNYATNVTPTGDVRQCRTSSVGGRLLVYCDDATGVTAPARFGFVTYKP